MGFRINTNTPASAANRAVSKASDAKGDSLNKLSSGDRILKAADDASGLAISEKLKAGIRSSRQASRNANDGISMIQVAEGGIQEASNLLIRMRELSVQAASDTSGESERAMTNMEFQGLKKELKRISGATEFNGTKLLDGTTSKLDFHVGTGGTNTNERISFQASEVNSSPESLGLAHANLLYKSSAQDCLGKLDTAINKLVGHRTTLGAVQTRLTASSNNLDVSTENISAANSRIRDTDYAEESARLARNSIVEQASVSVLAQANDLGKAATKLVA